MKSPLRIYSKRRVTRREASANGTTDHNTLSLAGDIDRENDAQLQAAIERLQRRRVMHSNAN